MHPTEEQSALQVPPLHPELQLNPLVDDPVHPIQAFEHVDIQISVPQPYLQLAPQELGV